MRPIWRLIMTIIKFLRSPFRENEVVILAGLRGAVATNRQLGGRKAVNIARALLGAVALAWAAGSPAHAELGAPLDRAGVLGAQTFEETFDQDRLRPPDGRSTSGPATRTAPARGSMAATPCRSFRRPATAAAPIRSS